MDFLFFQDQEPSGTMEYSNSVSDLEAIDDHDLGDSTFKRLRRLRPAEQSDSEEDDGQAEEAIISNDKDILSESHGHYLQEVSEARADSDESDHEIKSPSSDDLEPEESDSDGREDTGNQSSEKVNIDDFDDEEEFLLAGGAVEEAKKKKEWSVTRVFLLFLSFSFRAYSLTITIFSKHFKHKHIVEFISPH